MRRYKEYTVHGDKIDAEDASQMDTPRGRVFSQQGTYSKASSTRESEQILATFSVLFIQLVVHGKRRNVEPSAWQTADLELHHHVKDQNRYRPSPRHSLDAHSYPLA